MAKMTSGRLSRILACGQGTGPSVMSSEWEGLVADIWGVQGQAYQLNTYGAEHILAPKVNSGVSKTRSDIMLLSLGETSCLFLKPVAAAPGFSW